MKCIIKFLSVTALSFFLAGCITTKPKTTPLQRRAIESKEFEAGFDDVFRATLTVLQDQGYAIKNSDYNAGVIRGEGNTKLDFWGNSTLYELTATIEKFTEVRTKMRLMLVKKITGTKKSLFSIFGGSSPPYPVQTSNIVDEPKFIQRFYAQIQKEIFIRQNLNK